MGEKILRTGDRSIYTCLVITEERAGNAQVEVQQRGWEGSLRTRQRMRSRKALSCANSTITQELDSLEVNGDSRYPRDIGRARWNGLASKHRTAPHEESVSLVGTSKIRAVRRRLGRPCPWRSELRIAQSRKDMVKTPRAIVGNLRVS